MAHSEIVELIVTTSSVGNGTGGDPFREITEYFTKDGERLFTVDKWREARQQVEAQGLQAQ
jgi:hypothetical protein